MLPSPFLRRNHTSICSETGEQVTRTLDTISIAPALATKRKDGAPSVRVMSGKAKGGPPAQVLRRITHVFQSMVCGCWCLVRCSCVLDAFRPDPIRTSLAGGRSEPVLDSIY